MPGMASFAKKFGRGERPKVASLSSYNDREEEESSGMGSFVKKFTTKGDEYSFDFKNEDGSVETVKMSFDKEEHIYYRIEVCAETGEASWVKVPGITTILAIKDKSQALMPWAARETVNYVKAAYLALEEGNIAMMMDDPLRLQDWMFSTLDEATKNYRNLAKDAADVGRQAHDWLEKYITAKLSDSPPEEFAYLFSELSKLDERAVSCCRAALDWMEAHNVRWEVTEMKVYSRTYDVAGTLDGVCITDSCSDPKCCPSRFRDVRALIDWKSSNYLNETYRWQTAIYKVAYEEIFPKRKIQHRWAIRLGKFDGAFDPWHIYEEDFAMDLRCFLACLELTRASEDCIETVRCRKREEKAKAKAEREEKEAAEKAERLRIRTAKREASAGRKEKYKYYRSIGDSVAAANIHADQWLAKRLAEIGGNDNEEDEVEEAA